MNLNDLGYFLGRPAATAILKQTPDDFIVEEQIAYELSGEGEHLWCWIEKIGQNTEWVVKQLAQFAGISARNVGVAGKKDRHARTYQWMSLHLPGQPDPDFSGLAVAGVQVLTTVRHNRKLQTGGLQGNQFTLTLHKVRGERSEIESRLTQLQQGMPNFFGEQRFGQGFANLEKASALFSGQLKQPKRHQKGLYLSAARSWLFNTLLSRRIDNGSWNHYVPGDVFQLDGSSRCFVDDGAPDLADRIAQGDIHPTGLMTGRGRLLTQGEVADWENQVVRQFPEWQTGLEKSGLKQERRALRVLPKQLAWHWLNEDCLQLNFALPAGSYATMLVREVCCLAD